MTAKALRSLGLSDHQSLKHGIAMPRHDDIPEETLGQLADWLETLAP